MKLAELDYVLPPELIAHEPTEARDGARLLVPAPGGQSIANKHVRDLANLLPPKALLIVNDTRVIPARLLGTKPTGGRVEVLLLERLSPKASAGEGETWDVLVRSSKGIKVGNRFAFGALGNLNVEIRTLHKTGGVVEAHLTATQGTVRDAIESAGVIPLPPYIERAAQESDKDRYQTIFAREDGAVAAPTAGLHFTPELQAELEARGFEFAAVTLHVGLGTFRPVAVDDLDDHPMHEEAFTLSATTRDRIANARREGRVVVAIGTTSLRALESAASPTTKGEVDATVSRTRLFIQPGYEFRVVDRLFTNFHLPKSTLLALVMAFAGTETIRRAYEEAVKERYRFFSYGDAMLLERNR